jgi:outer membrane immunogenic protein
VFGLEGDGGYLDLTAKKFDPNFPGGTFTRLLPGAYGDVTGRIGFAFDRALLYAKGGWAGFGGEGSVNNTKGNFGGGEAYSNSFSGWTIGGGLEYMFAPNWSGKIEYQHFDFGTQTALLVTPAFGNFRYTHDLTADAVTVGLNFYLH